MLVKTQRRHYQAVTLHFDFISVFTDTHYEHTHPFPSETHSSKASCPNHGHGEGVGWGWWGVREAVTNNDVHVFGLQKKTKVTGGKPAEACVEHAKSAHQAWSCTTLPPNILDGWTRGTRASQISWLPSGGRLQYRSERWSTLQHTEVKPIWCHQGHKSIGQSPLLFPSNYNSPLQLYNKVNTLVLCLYWPHWRRVNMFIFHLCWCRTF